MDSKRLDAMYGRKVDAFVQEMQRKYVRKFPGLTIKASSSSYRVSEKYGPEFRISIWVPAKTGTKKDAPRIAVELSKAIKAKVGGRAFKGRYQETTLGDDALAPVNGWSYTVRYYPHADKMKDDPAFESVEDAENVDDPYLTEAASQSLTKMLPWADDPEFGGANAI